MKVITATTADDDMLNNAQFDPVFDENGDLVDIVHLKVTTDRSRGIKAMLELANSHQPGDEIIHQDGWTQKQKRILNSPAPGAAHTIKRSKRWDAAIGQFVPTATLILPSEVVWVLFEELFANNYSVQVKEVIHESEDIISSGVDGGRDLPGRIFYSRACVTLTLHLSNGSTRTFEGLGVAYDSVRMEMTGNVYAVNSARRTAEKGAISDAKREALANMGRVFRRAFEDGAEALRVIEEKLMEKMRVTNAPKGIKKSEAPVAAPRVVTQQPQSEVEPDDVIPGDYIPAEAFEERQESAKTASAKDKPEAKKTEKAVEKAPQKAKAEEKREVKVEEKPEAKEEVKTKEEATTAPQVTYVLKIGKQQETFQTPQAIFDAAIAHLDTLDDDAGKGFLETNKASLLKAENDDEIGELSYQDLLEMLLVDAQEEEEDTVDPGLAMNPEKMTGEAILKAYEKAFEEKPGEINAILDANTELAKRLTKRQKAKLAQMVMAANS